MSEIIREIPKEWLEAYEKKFEEVDDLVMKISELKGEKKNFHSHILMAKCEDPSIFAYVYLRDKKGQRYKVYPYQDMILNDHSKRIILAKGRQIGATDALAIQAFHEALFNDRFTVGIVSKTQPMAKRIIDRIREFRMNTPFDAELMEGGGVDNKFELQIRKRKYEVAETDPVDGYRRKKSSYSKIISVVAGESARGWDFDHVMGDESAFIGENIEDGDHIYYGILEPTVAHTHGKITLVSTPPMIPAGFFHDIFANRPSWSRYHFPSAICPDITQEYLDGLRSEMLDSEFRREYLGEFFANKNCVFTEMEIDAAVDKNLNMDVETMDPVYIGIDWGETNAQSAYAMVKCVQGHDPDKVDVQVVRLKEFPQRTDYQIVINEVANLCKSFNVRQIVPDKGIGGGQISQMLDMGLPVEGYSFSGGQRKADLVTTTKLLFEKRRMHIPNHVQLIRELKNYQQEYNEKSNRTAFFAPVAGNIRDHLLDAFMLANFSAVNLAAGPIGIQMVASDSVATTSKIVYAKKVECVRCGSGPFEGEGMDECPYCGNKELIKWE